MPSPQRIILVLLLVALGIGGALWYFSQGSTEKLSDLDLRLKAPGGGEISPRPEEPVNIKIESPAFLNNQYIPSKYTCDGENVNPPLSISEVPEGAKSLVLIIDDPDAPVGTWVHWTVWNINPEIGEIPENTVPEGAKEGITDFGKPGYGGPCPSSGSHRYFFRLYALDITIDLNSSAKVKDVEKTMEGHILEQAQLIGLYQRQ